MSAIIQDVPNLTAAFPVDPPSISFPLASENNYARAYTQNFMAPSGYEGTGSMGAAGIFPNTVLVMEGDRSFVGGGYCEFPRTYAEVPAGFNTYEGFIRTIPITGISGRTYQDTAYKMNRVWNDFFNTSSPQSITLSGAQRFIGPAGYDPPTLSATTSPTYAQYAAWAAAGTEFVAQDSTLDRYMGPIWWRRTYYVKAQ